MSRRKQTKPFKVEDEDESKNEKKTKLRKIAPKHNEPSQAEVTTSQADVTSENISDDCEDEMDSVTRRSKRHAKCNQCGKMLASALSLARHRLTHSEKKPYQCPKCDSSFKTSSNMHRHLRIHFREMNAESEEPPNPVVSRPPSMRSPRQNIRTPNKFKEFDVHLVGQGQRILNSSTNARSYTKPQNEQTAKHQRRTEPKSGKGEPSTEVGTDEDGRPNTNQDESVDELPDLDSPARGRKAAQGAKAEDTDLVCHICSKTFISKFGLQTHSISHPDLSTRCNLCDQGFATHKGLVMHNVIVHKIIESRNEGNSSKSNWHIHGFDDLVSVEFSADKFPLIAESMCSFLRHKHPVLDRQHIFVCKTCDKAFPLLQSLKLHVNKEHSEIQKNQESKMTDGIKILPFLQSVGLCQQGEGGMGVESKDLCRVRNGMDDDAIYASPSVATNIVPAWLQEKPDVLKSAYENVTESEVTKHPRLTLKIVRKRSSPLPLPSNSDEKEASEGYFIDSSGSKCRKRSTLGNARGSKGSSSGLAISRFGTPNKHIEPVRSLSGERNVFWCRICNYSSHEKSALVRHLLTHSGIRPYFCKLCNYAFTTKANCERHVRKRHNCRDKAELDAAVQCDWEMLKKAPRDDIYMITGSNSACPVCAKTFSCNNDLKEHLKVHEERLFICQLCSIRCTTRNNCVRHILHKHPGIPHQEANNIITFAASKSKNLDMRKLSDIVEDKPEIDISRGSLGRRSAVKSSHNTRCKLKRPSAFEENGSASKKQRTRSPTSNKNLTSGGRSADVPDYQKLVPADIPTLSSAEKDNDRHLENHSPRRSTKNLLPLIPLLKIKAYNEATAGTYESMLSMYQGLNFFKNFFNSSKAGDGMEMHEQPTESDTSRNIQTSPSTVAEETVFMCHTCSTTFSKEGEFNHHSASCLGSETDHECEIFAMDGYQVFNSHDMLRINQDAGFANDNIHAYAALNIDSQNENYLINDITSEGAKGEQGPKKVVDSSDSKKEGYVTGIEDIVNVSQGTCSLHTQVFEKYDFKDVDDWDDNAILHSPNSGKSIGTGSPTQSNFSSSFITGGPRVFASNGKESSYVEDSLLLSMFGDGDAGKGERASTIDDSPMQDNTLSISRYSASFPTMVNMDNPALSKMKYQETSEMEDKVLVPSKGRFYTARKCPQCEKTFPWASSLRRHIMTHTGLKLYMCRLCKMRFTTRSNLIRHVYRRHGMAKQHPDFASCLAKLHPSDTLLKEVEADVRRRFDGQKNTSRPEDVELDGGRNLPQSEEDFQEDMRQSGRRRAVTSDFQSMLEEDPETMLVDLDYSPRDDLPLDDVKKPRPKLVIKSPIKKNAKVQHCGGVSDPQDEQDSIMPGMESAEFSQEEVEQEPPIHRSLDNALPREQSFEEIPGSVTGDEVAPYYGGKTLRPRSTSRLLDNDGNSLLTDMSLDDEKEETIYNKCSLKPKIRNKQSTQFVCGLCKKIFKTVPDLIGHLDTHNVPHSWHCPVCGVPFTNKYNCQRHLTRRHGASHVEPLYVEDSKHGPRTARGHPRKTPVPSEDENMNLSSV